MYSNLVSDLKLTRQLKERGPLISNTVRRTSVVHSVPLVLSTEENEEFKCFELRFCGQEEQLMSYIVL